MPTEPPNPNGDSVTTSFLRTIVVVLLLGIFVVSLTLITKMRPEVVRDSQDTIPIFYLVWLAAVVGSAVNVTTQAEPARIPTGFFDKVSYLAWKLLIAITFATFLYVLFASEIISGDTFPKFQNVRETDYLYPVRFMNDCKLATNQDVAKMLVWAFIAGYLERFVPNIISRIQTDSEKKS
jgi:hypothetical protein